jgi:hypothetical protein
VSGTRQWQNLRLGEETGLTAAVCSIHADGHLRERAVMVLAGRPGTRRVAFLALRCADHVPQVREAARLGLAVHTEVAEAEAALAVLVSLTGRQHGPDAVNDYTEALITRHGQSVFPELCSSRDMDTRRWAYRHCLQADLLPVSDLVQAARAEPDQLIRSLCAERLARTATPDVVRGMLHTRYVDGRLSALSHLPDDDMTDDDILTALLDRSARLVTAAATTWRRPSPEQAATIGKYLAHDDLDESVARIVAFHAGLPTSPRPEVDRPTAPGPGASVAGRTFGARLRSWLSSNPRE